MKRRRRRRRRGKPGAQSAVQVNDNWPMTPKSQSIAEAAKVRPIRHSGKMMVVVVVMRMMRDQPFAFSLLPQSCG